MIYFSFSLLCLFQLQDFLFKKEQHVYIKEYFKRMNNLLSVHQCKSPHEMHSSENSEICPVEVLSDLHRELRGNSWPSSHAVKRYTEDHSWIFHHQSNLAPRPQKMVQWRVLYPWIHHHIPNSQVQPQCRSKYLQEGRARHTGWRYIPLNTVIDPVVDPSQGLHRFLEVLLPKKQYERSRFTNKDIFNNVSGYRRCRLSFYQLAIET